MHTWERKSLINERFFKMQHLASRLNEKIDSIKKSMNRNMEDLMHRTKELSRKTEVEIKEKIIELKKAVENSNKQALEMD